MEQQEYVSPSVELEPEDDKSPFDRFAEVFTSPADAFAGLGGAKKGPIILWGMIILAVVSVFTVVLFSSNETLRETAHDQQIEKFEKMRDQGKISQKQYEQQVEGMELMTEGPLFMVAGAIGAAIFSALFAIFAGVVVLILIRILQRDHDPAIGFATALSAAIIAFMITNVESIITAIGMTLTSNPDFRVSPALMGAPENSYLKFLVNLVNPFTIWTWFALGTGVALLARTDRMRGIISVAASYIVIGLIATAIGTFFASLFGG